MFRARFQGVALLAAATLLAACGNYDGAAFGAGDPPQTQSTTVGAKNCDELFTQRVQPRLAFCRNCHVPAGIADVPDGKRFMLSTTAAEDLVNLRTSWERLGRNDSGPNLILTMPAGTAGRTHSGGTPWPPSSDAYKDMDAMLKGFVDPAACVAGGGTPVQERPLLGSKRARHLWESYCEGRDDAASLPADPRSRVQAGANSGKAVFFNSYWEDCHVHAPEAEKQARTCGEYRQRRDRGREFLLDELPVSSMTAVAYNDTWKKWGLTARPANFDEMYTLRYGLNRAPFHNPYPLAGEDPNTTNGGSGRLPLGLRQLKGDDGKWTGQIGSAACFLCHGGQIDDPDNRITMDNLGLGNNNYDVVMSAQDGSPFSGTPLGTLLPPMDASALFNIGIKQRGQNNAVGAFEFLNTLLDVDSLGVNPNPLKSMIGPTGIQDISHPLAHTQDTPAWWNMGSRPRKFFDAGVSNDSTRIIMAAGPGELETLFTMDGVPYRERIEQYDQDLEAFFLSLQSPEYPRPVDTALAEQGAVLFHSKDLWAHPDNAARPRPLGGNGSCASCHGAYSPRYVHDPAYLENPVLEGVAGHISPLDVIGTDTARSDMLTPTLRRGWVTTYWGYPEGMPGYVAPQDKDPLTELADDMSPMRPDGLCEWQQDVIGYQAPPLYGTWATAPYFHNGAVPTIEQVLDSSKRSPIWRRKLQSEGPVTGFDQRLDSAYDFSALGWQHEVLACDAMPGSMPMNCNPVTNEGPALPQLVQNFLNGTISWTGLVSIPDPAPGSIDKRLVYDTRTLGNSNAGHTFTDVLTAEERKAVIEYLKTL